MGLRCTGPFSPTSNESRPIFPSAFSAPGLGSRCQRKVLVARAVRPKVSSSASVCTQLLIVCYGEAPDHLLVFGFGLFPLNTISATLGQAAQILSYLSLGFLDLRRGSNAAAYRLAIFRSLSRLLFGLVGLQRRKCRSKLLALSSPTRFFLS